MGGIPVASRWLAWRAHWGAMWAKLVQRPVAHSEDDQCEICPRCGRAIERLADNGSCCLCDWPDGSRAYAAWAFVRGIKTVIKRVFKRQQWVDLPF